MPGTLYPARFSVSHQVLYIRPGHILSYLGYWRTNDYQYTYNTYSTNTPHNHRVNALYLSIQETRIYTYTHTRVGIEYLVLSDTTLLGELPVLVDPGKGVVV